MCSIHSCERVCVSGAVGRGQGPGRGSCGGAHGGGGQKALGDDLQ